MQVLPKPVLALRDAANASTRERAWAEFLADYNKLILHVCHKFGGGYDAVMDRYAFVLQQLQRDEMRWLSGFDISGRGKFTTWFVVVLRRICLDERRKRYGRPQAKTAAAEEQDRVRRDLVDLIATQIDSVQIADAGGLPDEVAAAAELRDTLNMAVSTLDPEDRLILRFRFEQELSVPEIAKLIGAQSPFHVYRRIDKILTSLRQQLSNLSPEHP
jgi:RNA polymerase sigma factor (sigma-70 family)